MGQRQKNLWPGIGIPKYLNMHKNLYKFFKKRNKCDVTNKSTITKITISEKKVVETIRKSTKRETKLERKYWPFLL